MCVLLKYIIIQKLQVAAAEAIRKEKEAKEKQIETIPPLRLSKHLDESSRSGAPPQPALNTDNIQNGLQKAQNEESKQVHFEETEEQGDYEEDYEHDYDHNDDSDRYYNEVSVVGMEI